MARTTDEIIQQMDDAQAGEPGLSQLNSPSQSAIYRLWKYITSQVIQYFEQLVDLKKDDLNQIVAKSAVPSDAWLKAKVLEFQYDSTGANPQVIQLINFVPSYNPVDETKRIITRCSVKTTAARTVTVKVAKNDNPPEPLIPLELNALKGYLTNTGSPTSVGMGIGFAGIQLNVVSLPPDNLYIKATITYNGQYASTIQDGVKGAINQYLIDNGSLINFDGSVKVLDVIDYIQRVPGVYDIKMENLALMADGGTYIYLVQSFTQLATEYPTYAGYAVIDPTIQFNQLTFVAR